MILSLTIKSITLLSLSSSHVFLVLLLLGLHNILPPLIRQGFVWSIAEPEDMIALMLLLIQRCATFALGIVKACLQMLILFLAHRSAFIPLGQLGLRFIELCLKGMSLCGRGLREGRLVSMQGEAFV